MTSSTNGGSRITAAVAQQLIGTYKNEEGWPPDKTRAVWFSLDAIADIQALISASAGDGIRIYFGKYPSDVDIPGTPDPAYKGKVTLIMIPTVTGSDGSHNDIFPPVAPGTMVALDDGGTGYDHGSLCPPNCPTEPPPGS
ncbi:MAG: hypothetical protein J0H74_01265 [Chitinophagaceae bacterium]|nr:hypothetical protein [Chitinophagaceae bacterium]